MVEEVPRKVYDQIFTWQEEMVGRLVKRQDLNYKKKVT